MKRLSLILLAVLALSAAGCGGDSDNSATPTDPVAAEAAVQAGLQALSAGDVAAARAQFATAVSRDPGNPRAQLGLTITDLYLLESDPQIAPLLDQLLAAGGPVAARPATHLLGGRAANPLARLGVTPAHRYDATSLGRGLFSLLLVAAEDPPQVSEVQQLLKTVVLARLAAAEGRLGVIETQPGFVWRIPPSVTDEPDTIEIDLGEVYMLDALINQLQGIIGLLVPYNFDVNYASVNPESLLTAGTDWGTLHADGAAQLAAARQNMLLANTRLHSAIASINNETDDQSDDVIPIAALSDVDLVDFVDGFDVLHAALNGPQSVEIYDYQNQQAFVDVHLGAFFTNPMTDLKAKLPNHTFGVNGDPVVTNPITFPDPTFNGLFPNMTNVLWQQLVGPVSP
jgi:hypothetical protein